jgi:hypothetical protein
MKNFKKIIEYGLYALVFLLPWQTKLILRAGVLGKGDWEYGTIALYGIDILLVVLLILFFILSRRTSRETTADFNHPPEPPLNPSLKRRGNPWKSCLSVGKGGGIIWIILSGLDLFVFISIFFAPDIILAAYRYILFLLGLGLFWLIVKVKYDNKKMAIAFFSGLILQSGLAIWQFLDQGTFANKWLGLAIHNPSDLGTSVIETVGADGVPERWLRAYGSLDHPNILGGLLAVGLIIFICYFINLTNKKQLDKNVGKNNSSRNNFTSSREGAFLTSYFLLLTLFLGLIFTFSRSAALAMLIGLIIFLIFIIKQKNWLQLKRLGLAVLIAAAMLGLIFASYSNLFITRTQVSSRLEIKSLTERSNYLKDSFKVIKRDWLFGIGIGNYTRELAVENPQRPWFDLEPVHNAFLLVWAEIGIFGLAFFIALLAYIFIQSWKKNNALNLSIIAVLVIIMMFDHYLWSLPFGIVFFWLAIGFVYKNLNND